MKRISIAAAAAMLAFTQNFASSPGQSFVVEKVRGQNRPECEIPVRAGALPRAPQPMTVTQRANAVKPPYKVPGVEPVKLPGGNTVLAGALVYSDLWGQTDASGNYVNPITAGFYTVEAREGGKISQLRLNQALVRMRAGVKVGTHYYGISTADQDERAFLTTYYTSSWSTRSQEEIDVVNVPTDLTYSTATGTVYGFFYNDEHQNYDRFCTYNLYDGEATDLYEVDRNGYAVAANDKGEIYGIMGATGWLIRLYPDRRSSPNGYGFEYIGKTGFSPGYVNSMAFDDATGKLYWCANGIDGYSALLEVDTTTGAATEIMHFDNNESFAGIFAQPYRVPDAAPAAPSGLTVNYSAPGALTATLECVMPSASYNGGALAGPLSAVFSVDGAVVAQIDGLQPGAAAMTETLTLPEGESLVEVFAASASYRGDVASATAWGGEDTPAAVTALTLADVDGRPTLSWEAPAAGIHGQWFDPAGLTYTVTRLTDNASFTGITATTWADEAPAGMAALAYSVTAVNARGESPAVTTPKMVFGSGFAIPFTVGFDSEADFELWRLFDLNGNTTWVYDPKEEAVSYSYGTEVEREGDDWLISPRFSLSKGVTYALLFSAKSRQARYTENFRFCLGTADNPDAMTRVLADRPGYDNAAGYRDERVLFTVDADGIYYLGLHCYSPAHNWTLYVDNIGIMEVSAQVPAPVEALAVTPGAQGAQEATVTMTAPAAYASGDEMTSPVNVALYRNDSATPCKSWNAVEPGAGLSWTDTSFASAGTVTYRAVASNSHGAGEACEASAFVGVDLPGPVENLTLTEGADGAVTLSWDAPAGGANGGWFDPSGLTYRVMRSIDVAELADGLAATSFTDRTISLDRQELCYYLVWPVTADGRRGTYANTPLNVVLGPALRVPVSETFAGADMSLYPWTDESDGSVRLWTLENSGINPPCADQNGDRGLAMCIATANTAGLTGYFLSPKISLDGVDEPELSFWFYHSASPGSAPAVSETLTVEVAADHGEYKALPGAVMARDNGTAGWSRYAFSLAEYSGAGFIRLRFAGKSAGVQSMYIDNIAVGPRRHNDVELTSASGPGRIASGIEASYEVIVSNLGAADADVLLSASFAGVAVAPQVAVTVPAAATATVEVPAVIDAPGSGQLLFEVTCDGDENLANNTLGRRVEAVEPVRPVPADLSARADGLDVILDWTAPQHNPAVTDDVESYTDFAIDGIGDYLMVDRDWSMTYSVNNGVDYPFMSDPKSFQVLNAARLGIDVWSEGQPHSGNRFFGSISAMNGVTDDWMISPLLNGAEQTIAFWAKSMTTDGVAPERMRVFYSTGSVDPQDFVAVHQGEYVELPDMWTLYRFVLPAGARRFAINCVSHDSFVMMVDDLSFNDLTVLPDAVCGYELLRDGEVVAATEVPSAIDRLEGYGTYTYAVRARFGEGDDAPFTQSASVRIEVAPTAAGAAAVLLPEVKGCEGMIAVSRAPEMEVTVVFPDGRLLSAGRAGADGNLSLPASSGIYLVTVGGVTHRVLVR